MGYLKYKGYTGVWDILTFSVTFSPEHGDKITLSGTFCFPLDIFLGHFARSLDIFARE